DVRPREWFLDAMQAQDMWKVSTGRDVTVAVIDSGVDDSVPELRGRVLQGKDFTDNPTNAHDDRVGHGTEMASLIAGTGADGGIQGLAPGSRILPLRNLSRAHEVTFSSRGLIEAIRYAANSDAQIINISQGLTGVGGESV